MNIKTKLIVAATAVSLLSTPAFAFRDMGDAGGNSAFAVPEQHGYSRNATSAYASGRVIQPRHVIQPQPRLPNSFTGADAGHN